MLPAVFYSDYKWLGERPVGPTLIRDSTNKITYVASYLSVGQYITLGQHK